MNKFVLLTSLVAGIAISSSAVAQGQDRFSGPLRSSTNRQVRDPTQMSVDVSQYDPSVQISEILRTTKMLVQQNEQLRAELDAVQKKLDQIEGRGESIGRILITGTGETIGSMVRKIKDKTVGPY